MSSESSICDFSRATSACPAKMLALAASRLATAASWAASAVFISFRLWSSFSPVPWPRSKRVFARASSCSANVRSLSRWTMRASACTFSYSAFWTSALAAASCASISTVSIRATICPASTMSPSRARTSAIRPAYFVAICTCSASRRPFALAMPGGARAIVAATNTNRLHLQPPRCKPARPTNLGVFSFSVLVSAQLEFWVACPLRRDCGAPR